MAGTLRGRDLRRNLFRAGRVRGDVRGTLTPLGASHGRATHSDHRRIPEPDDLAADSADDFLDEEGVDRKILDSLLKNRSKDDLEWEKRNLGKLLKTLTTISARPSKIQALLDIIAKRQLPGGRIRQTVIFTWFYDTLTDIVAHFRRINPTMLIGTYSGRGGQFFDPVTARLKSVDREEVKHRFIREEIDVLVCTDAAAEGLNLQTANLLINFDLQ